MDKEKSIKIGLIVIIVAGILVWGINFCKGKNLFSKENLYYTTYTQVEGGKKTFCFFALASVATAEPSSRVLDTF